MFNIPPRQRKIHHEQEPLLNHRRAAVDEEALPKNPVIEKPPKVRDVLTFQTTMNLVVYTLLALYTLTYDQVRRPSAEPFLQGVECFGFICFPSLSFKAANNHQLLPVLMHHPRQAIDDPNVSLPLRFAGGFGIDSRRIGAIFTIFSISSTLSQFLLFPPLARTLGVLRCLRIAFLIFPIVFFITPFVTLLPDQATKEVTMVVLLMIRGVGGTFAFPTSTIMLTNSATSLRVLGTINGLATSVAAVGRAVGPAIGGGLFTWGVKRGYIIVPFWTLSAISFIAWIPTLWLEEGKGFGDDPDSDVDSVVSASASSADESEEEVAKSKSEIDEDEAGDSESEYGEPTNLLTYASTRSSEAIATEDEMDFSDHDAIPRRHGRRGTFGSMSHARSHSHGRRVRRRSSVPVGMGLGFRRLSSNLGSTGIGGAGPNWGGT